MSMPADAASPRAGLPAMAAALLLPAYVATIFLSAFLLFSVQPMFTKMVTPVLGGSSAVWSVAMVFFQAMLLAGYAYAHALGRFATPRTALIVHLGLMLAAAAVALPIAFDPAWGRPPADGEALWLMKVFLVSVGLPFFIVSANGPLLQAWFSRSGHPQAADPYFLYGASNLGSFLALLAYPLALEPLLALKQQSLAWSHGFVALLLCIAIAATCSLTTGGAQQVAQASPRANTAGATQTSPRQALVWALLGAVPSGLLVAVTAEITTDVAAVPLLWVVPLALYLLTFTLAFSERGARRHTLLLDLQPHLLAIFLFTRLFFAGNWWVIGVAEMTLFFVMAMVCHGEVYRRRPAADSLTAFYFFLSLGGVIGGAFASLAAPVLFNAIIEFPLLLLAAIACRPDVVAALRRFGLLRAAALGMALAAAFAWMFTTNWRVPGRIAGIDMTFVVLMGLILVLLLSRTAPLRFLVVASGALMILTTISNSSGLIERARSFFAVHLVKHTPDGRGHVLLHGSSVHGAEWVRDAAGNRLMDRPEPASYFHRGGSYDRAVGSIRAAAGGQLKRVAVIGLGMGSLACMARPGESWSFFEIDPVVVRLARDQRLFRSLSVCTPDAEVAVGDGRLTVADAPGTFDLIIVDAFSSNSVPVHLLTVEALATYKAKLSKSGALIFNISNRHMALDAVVAGAAEANGLIVRHRRDPIGDKHYYETLISEAHVAVAASSTAAMGPLVADPSWLAAAPDPTTRVWTDDYSNILDPLRRGVARTAAAANGRAAERNGLAAARAILP